MGTADWVLVDGDQGSDYKGESSFRALGLGLVISRAGICGMWHACGLPLALGLPLLFPYAGPKKGGRPRLPLHAFFCDFLKIHAVLSLAPRAPGRLLAASDLHLTAIIVIIWRSLRTNTGVPERKGTHPGPR